MHRELSADDSSSEIVQKVFRTSIQALEETLAILDMEDFDRAAIHARITEMEASIKSMPQDSLLDREIAKLDHFKQVNQHLQGTAMH